MTMNMNIIITIHIYIYIYINTYEHINNNITKYTYAELRRVQPGPPFYFGVYIMVSFYIMVCIFWYYITFDELWYVFFCTMTVKLYI